MVSVHRKGKPKCDNLHWQKGREGSAPEGANEWTCWTMMSLSDFWEGILENVRKEELNAGERSKLKGWGWSASSSGERFQQIYGSQAAEIALLCSDLVTANPDLQSTIERGAAVNRLRLAA